MFQEAWYYVEADEVLALSLLWGFCPRAFPEIEVVLLVVWCSRTLHDIGKALDPKHLGRDERISTQANGSHFSASAHTHDHEAKRYSFFMYELCDVYLELLKPRLQGEAANDEVRQENLCLIVLQGLLVFHPLFTHSHRSKALPSGRSWNTGSVWLRSLTQWPYLQPHSQQLMCNFQGPRTRPSRLGDALESQRDSWEQTNHKLKDQRLKDCISACPSLTALPFKHLWPHCAYVHCRSSSNNCCGVPNLSAQFLTELFHQLSIIVILILDVIVLVSIIMCLFFWWSSIALSAFCVPALAFFFASSLRWPS